MIDRKRHLSENVSLGTPAQSSEPSPKLSFAPCSERRWHLLGQGQNRVHVTGWAIADTGRLSDESLGRLVLDRIAAGVPFPDILDGLNGNFAVAAEVQGGIHIGVDAVRSIPLFYRNYGSHLSVSDDLRLLRREGDNIDEDSEIEYATAGYVTGPHTLFQEVFALQSGGCVSWRPGGAAPEIHRYYEYSCSYDADSSVETLSEEFGQVLLSAFGRLVDDLNDRQVVVPLSSGLDSRLVAATLKRLKYDNVLCVSYGVPANTEASRSRAVAEALGHRWEQVPYSRRLWHEALRSKAMMGYWSFSANGVSVPHCDDWLALQALRDHGKVQEGAVFIPGHTGDFISGSHLKYVFDPTWHEDPYDLATAIVKKHYSVWGHLVAMPGVRRIIERRIHETLDTFPRESHEDLARMYEFWEWQERQAKLIINSVRSYEFFGFSWRIPLWDRVVMDFWRRIPLDLKMNAYLYRRYLTAHNPAGVFASERPSQRWDRDEVLARRSGRLAYRAKVALRRFRPGAAVLDRYAQYRKHLHVYRSHPLGLAKHYGRFRYVLREPSKRNAPALLWKDFLDHEYGVDVRAPASRSSGSTSGGV